jgi:hypothetical protein
MDAQLSFVARHLDAFRFRIGAVPIDLLHEPTATLDVSLNPATYGAVAAQISGTLLNVHFQQHHQDFVELALGQMGLNIDSSGHVTGGSIGAQAEIHSSNPHFSVFLSESLTLAPGPGGSVTTAWGPLTFGILIHLVNP